MSDVIPLGQLGLLVARVVRRYSVGGARWLLVETASRARFSWPEAEAQRFSGNDAVIGTCPVCQTQWPVSRSSSGWALKPHPRWNGNRERPEKEACPGSGRDASRFETYWGSEADFARQQEQKFVDDVVAWWTRVARENADYEQRTGHKRPAGTRARPEDWLSRTPKRTS